MYKIHEAKSKLPDNESRHFSIGDLPTASVREAARVSVAEWDVSTRVPELIVFFLSRRQGAISGRPLPTISPIVLCHNQPESN
jgi:hypothetical protein